MGQELGLLMGDIGFGRLNVVAEASRLRTWKAAGAGATAASASCHAKGSRGDVIVVVTLSALEINQIENHKQNDEQTNRLSFEKWPKIRQQLQQ